MLKRRIKRTLLLALVVLITASLAGHSDAAISTFDFDVTFSGETPGGTSPYLTATIDDSYNGGKKVKVTVDAIGLDTMESVTKLYFNFNPDLDADLLTFKTLNSSDVDLSRSGYYGSDNAYKADGDGYYDIWIDLPPPPGDFASRFTYGEQLVFSIGYDETIDIGDFNYFSVEGGGNGSFLAAAHIQGINGDMSESGSGWVGATVVPEPISSTLFIVGAATMGFRRFRKNKKLS